jgi:hypothetical protein
MRIEPPQIAEYRPEPSGPRGHSGLRIHTLPGLLRRYTWKENDSGCANCNGYNW